MCYFVSLSNFTKFSSLFKSPVLLNVWPRNEVQFLNSSFMCSSSNSSGFSQPKRSARFFHSSKEKEEEIAVS